MRKLILFLVRYFTVILFLMLQVVAFVFIIQQKNYQRSTAHRLNAEWSGRLLATYSQIDNFVNLAPTNEQLASENAQLRSSLKSAYFKRIAKTDTIVDTLFEQQYAFISARVINNSFTKRNNYLTLNRGALHGIKPDMAVISPKGVVGIVKQVSKHYCTVLPIIHSRSLLSATFKKDGRFGSLSWNGKDHRLAQLTDVPRETEISIGDTLISDERSGAMPSGIFIGHVAAFEINPEDLTYNVEVNLAVDFSAIHQVYVVKNYFKEEREKLEAQTTE